MKISFRRVGVVLAALVCTLGIVGVVAAAPPEGDFEISDTSPLIDQAVTFTATGVSDPDGGTPTVSWDFGDGGADVGSPVSHQYQTGGDKTVTLTIADPEGAEPPTVVTRSLHVNFPPTAAISCSPSTVRQDQAIRCNANASTDAEGPLSYAWDDNGDGYNDGTGVNQLFAYDTPGPRLIRLRVTDSAGVERFAESAITVVNGAPAAAFTASPNPVQIGETVEFRGGASSDPGGSIMTYEWDLGDGSFGTPSSDPDVDRSYATAGTRRIRLRVTDNNGASNTAETFLRVNANPRAVFAIEPNPALINETVAFDPSGSNDDFDGLAGGIDAYDWDLDGNPDNGPGGDGFEVLQGDDSSPVTATYPTAGTRMVRLRVTDVDGATDIRSRPLTVQATRPRAGFTYGPQAPLPGQPIGFTSTSLPSSSPGPEITKTEWDFNYDPTQDFTTDALGANASSAYSTPGPKTVAIRVTETGGGFAVTSLTLVVNAPPQASFNVAPASPFDGDSVTFSSTSGDPDGPLTGIQWDLDADGQYDDASGPVVSRAYAAGARTVRLLVTDSRGATATAERRFDVLRRPPRLLGGVKISLFGNLTDKGARLKRLLVRTPAKATAKVTCKGRKCPKGTKKVSTRPVKTRRLRFKKFERVFPAGSLITVSVTRPGFIGQHTTIKIRGDLRRYIRRDRCLPAGGGKPIACPDS